MIPPEMIRYIELHILSVSLKEVKPKKECGFFFLLTAQSTKHSNIQDRAIRMAIKGIFIGLCNLKICPQSDHRMMPKEESKTRTTV